VPLGRELPGLRALCCSKQGHVRDIGSCGYTIPGVKPNSAFSKWLSAHVCVGTDVLIAGKQGEVCGSGSG
jgi:hypothetical protein